MCIYTYTYKHCIGTQRRRSVLLAAASCLLDSLWSLALYISCIYIHIWVPSPRDGQNWGTPYGDAVGSIVPDFPGMGSASSDLGVVALVCPKNVERCCVPRGGPILGEMGHGIVHFARGV